MFFLSVFHCSFLFLLFAINSALTWRPPSQNNIEFDDFGNLLNIVDKSSLLFTVILGGFHARSTSW